MIQFPQWTHIFFVVADYKKKKHSVFSLIPKYVLTVTGKICGMFLKYNKNKKKQQKKDTAFARVKKYSCDGFGMCETEK